MMLDQIDRRLLRNLWPVVPTLMQPNWSVEPKGLVFELIYLVKVGRNLDTRYMVPDTTLVPDTTQVLDLGHSVRDVSLPS